MNNVCSAQIQQKEITIETPTLPSITNQFTAYTRVILHILEEKSQVRVFASHENTFRSMMTSPYSIIIHNIPWSTSHFAIEIVDLPIKNCVFPIKNGGSFHSYVNVYQRVCKYATAVLR